jgi:hypothetical protein
LVYPISTIVWKVLIARRAIWRAAAAALAAKALQRRGSLARCSKEVLGCFRAPTAEAIDPEGRGGVHRLWGGLAELLLPRRFAGGRLLPAGPALPGVSGRCRSSRPNLVDVSNSSLRSPTNTPGFTRPRQWSHSAMKRLVSAKEGAYNAVHPHAGRKPVPEPFRALPSQFPEASSSVEQHGKPGSSFGDLLDELVGRGGIMGVQTCPKHRIERFFALSRSVRLRCVR